MGRGGRGSTRRRENWSTCPALTRLNFISTYLHLGTRSVQSQNLHATTSALLRWIMRKPPQRNERMLRVAYKQKNSVFKITWGRGLTTERYQCRVVSSASLRSQCCSQLEQLPEMSTACCHKQPGEGTNRDGGRCIARTSMHDTDCAGMMSRKLGECCIV